MTESIFRLTSWTGNNLPVDSVGAPAWWCSIENLQGWLDDRVLFPVYRLHVEAGSREVVR